MSDQGALSDGRENDFSLIETLLWTRGEGFQLLAEHLARLAASSAALGAVCSLFFGYAASGWLLPMFALAGAACGIMLLALLAGRSASLILFTLAGVILASLTGSTCCRLMRPASMARLPRR